MTHIVRAIGGSTRRRSPKSKRGKELNAATVAGRWKWDGQTRPVENRRFPRARPHISRTAQRVPMAAQLRGLAPEGAVRLSTGALPTRTPDVPRLSPPLDANGCQGQYSLDPFHAPTTFDCSTDRPTEWCGSEHPGGHSRTQMERFHGLHYFRPAAVEPVGVEAESASGCITACAHS